MTKAEATAIKKLLATTSRDAQEVLIRLELDTEGKVTLSAESMADSIRRLQQVIDSVGAVKAMAFAELED